MRVHQTAHQVHFNHREHSWKREMRKSWDFKQWWRKEEVERQDAQEEPQATVVLRQSKLRNFSGKGQDNIKYWLKDILRAVAQKPTNKEKIDFILDYLTRDAFEEVWHWCRFDITTTDGMYQYQVLGAAFGGGHKTKAHLERQFYNHKQQQGKLYANTRMHLWC